jgi:hypothetical protein
MFRLTSTWYRPLCGIMMSPVMERTRSVSDERDGDYVDGGKMTMTLECKF